LKLRTVVLAFLAAFLLGSAAAWAQMPQMPSFSADMKISGNGEGGTGKMYFNSDRHMRMEMNMHGHDAVILVDSSNPANPTSKILMPQMMKYMEVSAYGAGPGMRQKTPQVHVYDPSNPCSGLEGTTCKKVGVETVAGYVCDKWEFTGKDNQTVWISQQLHFPIKSVQKDGTTVEFSNIKQGPQDASLFVVPAGYTKFDPMGMAGQYQRPQ